MDANLNYLDVYKYDIKLYQFITKKYGESEKAWKFQKDAVTDLKTIDDIPKDEEDTKLRIYRFGWCGSPECGHRFEDDNDIKILGTPYLHEEYNGKCIVCGKETDTPAYAARTM